MKNGEAAKLLRVVAATWPRQAMSDETLKAYAEGIADLPEDLAMQAIERLRATEDWLPTVARIRRSVYGLAGFAPPSLDDAIEQASDYVRFLNQKRFINGSGYNPTAPTIHPIVLATLNSLGARNDDDWEEGFRFVYRDNIDSWKRDLLTMTFDDAKAVVHGA